VVLTSGLQLTPFYDGAALQPGHWLTGPAVVVYKDTTVLLQAGDTARVDRHCNLIVTVAALAQEAPDD
ncbi:MAG: hypothetical protein WAZ19_09780, partial [Anaerolineae bacterium]